MDVAQLLESIEASCVFFNASTGAARVDLTVNVVVQDESGAQIVASTPASVKGTRYVYSANGALLDAGGIYTYIFTPTVTTNVAPVVRIVPIRVGQTWITRIDAAISSITGTTPAQIWDYLTSNITTVGSIGAYLLSKLGLITQGDVNYTAPVSPNGERITIVQSQDYLVADGGQLPEWTDVDWTPFSLTTAASVTWYARTKYNIVVASGAVNVVSNTEIDIRTFANAVTRLFSVGVGVYDLQVWAVLNAGTHGGAQKLLVSAKMSVVDDIRN